MEKGREKGKFQLGFVENDILFDQKQLHGRKPKIQLTNGHKHFFKVTKKQILILYIISALSPPTLIESLATHLPRSLLYVYPQVFPFE